MQAEPTLCGNTKCTAQQSCAKSREGCVIPSLPLSCVETSARKKTPSRIARRRPTLWLHSVTPYTKLVKTVECKKGCSTSSLRFPPAHADHCRSMLAFAERYVGWAGLGWPLKLEIPPRLASPRLASGLSRCRSSCLRLLRCVAGLQNLAPVDLRSTLLPCGPLMFAF